MTFVYQIKKERGSQKLHLIELIMQIDENAIEPFSIVWTERTSHILYTILTACSMLDEL